tara:strand:- start:47 stop:676 length:630 start_codon:yes stop_codon:yes gene_type:complete
MFDNIIVPKSYLKGLLTKKQENLLKTIKRFGGSVRGIEFQTKCLENVLSTYKIYKQNLFINDKSLWNCEPPSTEQRTEDTPKKYPYEKGRWNKVGHNGGVNFYTSFYDEDENMWWVEFEFTFRNGVVDKKELLEFQIQETAEEVEAREKEWKKITAQRKLFERTLRYRLYNKISNFLFKLSQWAYQKTLPPVVKKTKTKEEKLSFWKHS